MKLKFYLIIFYLEFVVLNKFKPLKKTHLEEYYLHFSNFIPI